MRIIIRYSILLFCTLSICVAQAQDVYSFFDGTTVQLRWKGMQSNMLKSYKIYKTSDGQKLELGEARRIEDNKEIRKMVGPKTELFLKLAGATTSNEDFTDQLFSNLVANDEAYQFMGAMCVLNVRMAKAMGEYFSFIPSEVNNINEYTVYAVLNSTEEKIGSVSVNLSKKSVVNPIPNVQAAQQGMTVRISWDKLSDNSAESVGEFIYRGKSILGPYVRLNSAGNLFSTTDDDASYTDKYIDTGTCFYYVTCYNLFGIESQPSQIIEVQIKAELQGVLNGLKAAVVADRVKLTWDSVGQDLNYQIYRGSSRSEKFDLIYPPIQGMSNKSNSYIDGSAKEGISQFYFIEASNGNNRLRSDTIQFLLPDRTPPAKPKSVIGEVSKSGKVNISWAANEEDDILGYEIERYTGDSGVNNFLLTAKPIIATQFSEEIGAKSQSAYRYVVIAVDQSYNRSKASDPIRLRRPDDIPPAVPTITYVMLKDSVAHLRWTPNLEQDFMHYQVYKRLEQSWLKSQILKVNELHEVLTVSGLHEYKISAVDQDGNESEASEEHGLRYSKERTLSMPINGIAEDSASGVYLTWDVIENQGKGFLIERQELGSEVIQLVKEINEITDHYLDKYADNKKNYTYYITAFDDQWYTSKALEVKYSPEK